MTRENIELIRMLLRQHGSHCGHADCSICPRNAKESVEALTEFEELVREASAQ